MARQGDENRRYQAGGGIKGDSVSETLHSVQIQVSKEKSATESTIDKTSSSSSSFYLPEIQIHRNTMKNTVGKTYQAQRALTVA